MASLAADLKSLRLQVKRLQVEVSGRQSLDAMVIWDGHNEDYVNQKTSRMQEDFSGLIVHLTPEVSSSNRTVKDDELSQNEFIEFKKTIARSLDQSAGRDPQGFQGGGNELHQRSGVPLRQRQAVKSEAGAGSDHCPSGNGSGPRGSAIE